MVESQDSSRIRMLPHDDEAEKAVLGALLLNPEAWNVVSTFLDASDFYSPVNQNVFSAISDIVNIEGKKTFDGMVLVAYLRKKDRLEKCGGMGYIAQLTNVQVVVANIPSYCEIIKEASKRRLLYTLSNSLQKDVFDPAKDVNESLEQSSKELSDALLKGLRQNSQEYSLGNIAQCTFKEITDRMSNELASDRIETGFDVLDKYTNGGFAKEEYVIIAARPSIGKTAFALSMMYNMIRNNKRIAFFSLEMPAKTIAKRLFAIDSKLELSKIMKANFLDYEYDMLVDSCSRLYDLRDNMYIVDVPNISLTELRTKARVLANEKHIDCIVIDYIGLISVPTSYGVQKTFERVSMVSLALKQLARELKVPVVVLCQVGRESEEQAPILSNLRDSGSIEQDADIVCFLHRKKQLTEEEKQKNLVDNQGRASIQVTKFIIAKNRNGETGTFKIGYNGPLTYYADVAQDAEFIDYDPKPVSKK